MVRLRSLSLISLIISLANLIAIVCHLSKKNHSTQVYKNYYQANIYTQSQIYCNLSNYFALIVHEPLPQVTVIVIQLLLSSSLLISAFTLSSTCSTHLHIQSASSILKFSGNCSSNRIALLKSSQTIY